MTDATDRLASLAHTALAAYEPHLTAEQAESGLRRLLAGRGVGSQSTGGLLVVRTDPDGGTTARATDVYIHIGGWDEYGQFHLADGTFESPWPHVDDPEAK